MTDLQVDQDGKMTVADDQLTTYKGLAASDSSHMFRVFTSAADPNCAEMHYWRSRITA
jgi:hypothetical protein